MKPLLRILGLLVLGAISIHYFGEYQRAVELEDAQNICTEVEPLISKSKILNLADKNGWFVKELENAAMISIEKYSCACLFFIEGDKIVKIHGAICQD